MNGQLIAIFTAILFPLSNSFFRRIDTKVSPVQINAVRTTIGVITFIIMIILVNKISLVFDVGLFIILLLLMSIIFGQILGDSFYFESQKKLGPTIALALSMTFPFFTFLINILLGDIIPLSFFVSAILITTGILLITNNLLKQDLSSDAKNLEGKYFGILMGLLASICWAIGIVFTEYGFDGVNVALNSEEYSNLIGNIIRLPFAAVILLYLGFSARYNFYSDNTDSSWKFDGNIWKWLLAGSIIGTSLGMFVYTEAVRQAGSSFTSIIVSASPIFSIPITWLLNKEKISTIELAGVFLTVIGIFIVLIF